MESNGPSSFKNRGAQPNDQNGGLFFPLFYSIIGAQMPNVYDIDQTSWTAWKSTLSKQRAPSVYFRVKQLTDLILQNSASSNPIGSNIFYFFFFSPYVLTMNPTHYHLEVQAKPKKMAPKNRCYFQHLWEKRNYPMTFFLNSHCGLSRSLRSNDDRC